MFSKTKRDFKTMAGSGSSADTVCPVLRLHEFAEVLVLGKRADTGGGEAFSCYKNTPKTNLTVGVNRNDNFPHP